MSITDFGNNVLDQLEANGFDVKNSITMPTILRYYQFPFSGQDIIEAVEELKMKLPRIKETFH